MSDLANPAYATGIEDILLVGLDFDGATLFVKRFGGTLYNYAGAPVYSSVRDRVQWYGSSSSPGYTVGGAVDFVFIELDLAGGNLCQQLAMSSLASSL